MVGSCVVLSLGVWLGWEREDGRWQMEREEWEE